MNAPVLQQDQAELIAAMRRQIGQLFMEREEARDTIKRLREELAMANRQIDMGMGTRT